MKQVYELQEDQEWDIFEEMDSLIRNNPWTWQSIGAVTGLIGGVSSPALGTLLIAVASFIRSGPTFLTLNVLSIVSFVLTIPLLAFGAHCLDLLERKSSRFSLIGSARS